MQEQTVEKLKIKNSIDDKVKDFCEKYPAFDNYLNNGGEFPKPNIDNKTKKIKVFRFGNFVKECDTILDAALFTNHTPQTISSYVRQNKQTKKSYSFEYSDANIVAKAREYQKMITEYRELFKNYLNEKRMESISFSKTPKKTIKKPDAKKIEIKKQTSKPIITTKTPKKISNHKIYQIPTEKIFYCKKTGLAYYFNGLKDGRVQAKKTLYTNNTYTYAEIEEMQKMQ